MGRRWIGIERGQLGAPKVVYGEACRLGAARLAQERITFKPLPHAVPR